MRRRTLRPAALFALLALPAPGCAARVTVFEGGDAARDAPAREASLPDAAPDSPADSPADSPSDAPADGGCAFPEDPDTTVLVRATRVYSLGHNSRAGALLRPSNSVQSDGDLRVPRLALAIDTTPLTPPTRWPAVVAIADAQGEISHYEENEPSRDDPTALAPHRIERPVIPDASPMPVLDALEVRDGRYALLFHVPPAAQNTAIPRERLSGIYRAEDVLAIHDALPEVMTLHELGAGYATGASFVGEFTAGMLRRRVAYLTGTAQTTPAGDALVAPRVISLFAGASTPPTDTPLPTVSNPGTQPGLLSHGGELWYTRIESTSRNPDAAYTRALLPGVFGEARSVGPFGSDDCAVDAYHSTAFAMGATPGIADVRVCRPATSGAYPSMRFTLLFGEGAALGSSLGGRPFAPYVTVPYVTPRVAWNGSEFAVAYVDPSSLGVSLTVFSGTEYRRLGTYFVLLPRYGDVLPAGIDLIADPASGEWVLAVLGNETTAVPATAPAAPDSYLLRLGRCVSNEVR